MNYTCKNNCKTFTSTKYKFCPICGNKLKAIPNTDNIPQLTDEEKEYFDIVKNSRGKYVKQLKQLFKYYSRYSYDTIKDKLNYIKQFMVVSTTGKVEVRIDLYHNDTCKAIVIIPLNLDFGGDIRINLKDYSDVDKFIEDGKDLYDITFVWNASYNVYLSYLKIALEDIDIYNEYIYKYSENLIITEINCLKEINLVLDGLQNKRFAMIKNDKGEKKND